MNTRHHLITNVDGSVAIMQTVQQPDGSWPTVEECVAKWHPEVRKAVVSHKPIDPADIPTDRSRRNEWRHDGRKFHFGEK